MVILPQTEAINCLIYTITKKMYFPVKAVYYLLSLTSLHIDFHHFQHQVNLSDKLTL